jgi:hypothetical protein
MVVWLDTRMMKFQRLDIGHPSERGASAGESFDALDPQRTIIGTARCSARPLAHPGRPEQSRARTARPPLTVLAVGAVVTLATMHRDGWCYVRA